MTETKWPPGWYRTRGGAKREVVGRSIDPSLGFPIIGSIGSWNDRGVYFKADDEPHSLDLIAPWDEKTITLTRRDFEAAFFASLDPGTTMLSFRERLIDRLFGSNHE